MVIISARSLRLIVLPAASSGILIHSLYSQSLSIPVIAKCEAPSRLPTHTANRIGAFTYPANNPTEDRHIYGSFGEWSYSAVFDGHGGWQISDLASKRLIHIVANQLQAARVKETDELKIDSIISKSFHDMEEEIVANLRPAFNLGFGDVAKVGSCVLLALHCKDRLIIANCGDCRAVLGSSLNHSVIINRDHNCRVPLEQALLQARHPNEDNLVVCKSERACYVKGRLQLTRSLGDAYLKYHEFNGSPDRSRGRHIPEPYTPPYVSHEPELHHIRLTPDDKFVILGTDGLWDYVSHAEAVQLVSRCMAAGLTQEDAARALVERALQIAAMESGMSHSDLMKLAPGRSRRSRHDDTTAVVMYF